MSLDLANDDDFGPLPLREDVHAEIDAEKATGSPIGKCASLNSYDRLHVNFFMAPSFKFQVISPSVYALSCLQAT